MINVNRIMSSCSSNSYLDVPGDIYDVKRLINTAVARRFTVHFSGSHCVFFFLCNVACVFFFSKEHCVLHPDWLLSIHLLSVVNLSSFPNLWNKNICKGSDLFFIL